MSSETLAVLQAALRPGAATTPYLFLIVICYFDELYRRSQDAPHVKAQVIRTVESLRQRLLAGHPESACSW